MEEPHVPIYLCRSMYQVFHGRPHPMMCSSSSISSSPQTPLCPSSAFDARDISLLRVDMYVPDDKAEVLSYLVSFRSPESHPHKSTHGFDRPSPGLWYQRTDDRLPSFLLQLPHVNTTAPPTMSTFPQGMLATPRRVPALSFAVP